MAETPPWRWYMADPPLTPGTIWVRLLTPCAEPVEVEYASDPGELSYFNGDVYMSIPSYLAVMWREV